MFVAQIQAGHALQQEVHTATSELRDTVNLLTQATHQELEAINQTTTVLVDRLRHESNWNWGKSILVTVFQLWPGLFSCLPLCASQKPSPGIGPDLTSTSRSLNRLFGLVGIIWRLACFSTSLLTVIDGPLSLSMPACSPFPERRFTCQYRPPSPSGNYIRISHRRGTCGGRHEADLGANVSSAYV